MTVTTMIRSRARSLRRGASRRDVTLAIRGVMYYFDNRFGSRISEESLRTGVLQAGVPADFETMRAAIALIYVLRVDLGLSTRAIAKVMGRDVSNVTALMRKAHDVYDLDTLADLSDFITFFIGVNKALHRHNHPAMESETTA